MKKNQAKSFNKSLFYLSLFLTTGVFLLPKTAHLAGITSEKIIELTNKKRLEFSTSPLESNALLTKAAAAKAAAILDSQKFEHDVDGKKFSSWIRETGYNYSYVGENLAINFNESEDIIKKWLASPSHRDNLLNPRYKEIGIAVTEGIFHGENTAVVVQIFADPVSSIALSEISSPLSGTIYETGNGLVKDKLLTNSKSNGFFLGENYLDSAGYRINEMNNFFVQPLYRKQTFFFHFISFLIAGIFASLYFAYFNLKPEAIDAA